MARPDRLLLATRKGLIELRRGAGGWVVDRVDFPGLAVEYAARDPRDGSTWAAIDTGHWGAKLRMAPAGGDFVELPAPAFPEGSKTPGPPGRGQQEAKLEHIWTIAFGSEAQPGRVYLGTNPGGLFVRTEPDGPFALNRGLWDHDTREAWFGGGRDTPGIHSVLVDPRDDEAVTVGISCGGVFHSGDGGATWETRNKGQSAPFLPDPSVDAGHDPHHVVQAPSDPDVLWQQNHSGVFRSRDRGRLWEEVSSPDQGVYFGFPVAVSETDADTAWVVPAVADEQRNAVGQAIKVARTEDGGATWTLLTEGLPQAGAWDLVYRHALDLRGETLAFGSTTGNVYLSDDGGEAWQCLGNHFPPVYAVRFA